MGISPFFCVRYAASEPVLRDQAPLVANDNRARLAGGAVWISAAGSGFGALGMCVARGPLNRARASRAAERPPRSKLCSIILVPLNCALLEGHEVDLQIAQKIQFQMLWAFKA